MKRLFQLSCLLGAITLAFTACHYPTDEPGAANILGSPDYPAFSYGGYREATRDVVPTVEQLKDDLRILAAMEVKILRTYNTKYQQAANLLEAIRQLKQADPDFEMYVMLGTWIECEGAWTDELNHHAGDVEANTAEIGRVVAMANEYPDIVKIIAVGNEAMVQWAVNYFVFPEVILKWVNHLQTLKRTGGLPEDIWITSSDNFESWGGGAKNYQTDELVELMKAVDYISVHTYPFHDSHYNPAFWTVRPEEEGLDTFEQIDAAMLRAKHYAMAQTQAVADYMESVGVDKPIHIGETGWATIAASSYGPTGSHAADEYKEKIYYEHMRDWSRESGMSCFYFEAFDEQWKDQGNPLGSENHFGLINLQGEAKYALWDFVDAGAFDGLTRDGRAITKTYNGDAGALMADVLPPVTESEVGLLEIGTVNGQRAPGDPVTEGKYILVHESYGPDWMADCTYPSGPVKLNSWEGTCGIKMDRAGVIEVTTGTGGWWGCALEIKGGVGEDLSAFASGYLNFEIRGQTTSTFKLGFQTGIFAEGDQVNNTVLFGSGLERSISGTWTAFKIPLSELNAGANLKDVTGLFFLLGEDDFDGRTIHLKNIFYSRD
jgi:exo-beta-1,3-glucanase (GH17 family)